ncbi:MAG: NACHT domain-containing protein [Cyanobacteria bacterium P01_F01_bin.150]
MIETVVDAIAGPIFEQVWKAGGAVVEDIKKTYSKVDATNKLLAASSRYEQRYQQRHGQIKIMPGLMKEAVPLDSIYTAIKLLDERDKRYFRTEQELEDLYRKVGQRNFQIGCDQRLDGMEIASQEQFLMVLGGPGIGKSTFLRKIGAETLKPDGRIGQGLIPVLIELKTLKESDINLTTVIAREFEICGFPAATAFTLKALEQGKLMILLDGLDEVPKQNLNTVIDCIENFVDQYDQNHCVASCRIAAYNTSFRRFMDVTIAEFDDDQIQQFIDRWFSSDLDQRERTAEHYWALLSSKEHKATKELAQTPLLLTFLCLVYDRKQSLPPNRSSLYGRALNILLEDWAAQKRLERDPIYEGFHPELETELLADIAYSSFKDNQLFFSKADITDKIAVFLADTLDAPEHMDGAAVLTAIEVQQGILVERATDTYSFSHLTIQEYLTALHISSHWDTLGNSLIERYAYDDRWREVFLLMAGVLPGGSQKKLWHGLERAALTKATISRKVKALVEWADTITKRRGLSNRASALAIASDMVRAIASASVRASDSDSDSIFVIARARASASAVAIDSAVAVASASASANTIDRAIAIAIAIAIDRISVIDITVAKARSKDRFQDSDIASDIARSRAKASVSASARAIDAAIKKQLFSARSLRALPLQLSSFMANIPESNAPLSKWAQWIDPLKAMLIRGFDLTKEMVTLSKEDAATLRDYLYITELLIRCKESANRVSKTEWREVEARLLTLQEIPK